MANVQRMQFLRSKERVYNALTKEEEIARSLAIKYGPNGNRMQNQHWWSSKERSEVEKAQRATRRASDSYFALLHKLNVNTVGIPMHWFYSEDFTWEHASGQRPILNAPKAYGY